MYLKKGVLTALKVKNVLLIAASIFGFILSVPYIASEFSAYSDNIAYALGAKDMGIAITVICISIGLLLIAVISMRNIGNASFYSSYFEGDLDGYVTFADLSKVMGKSEGAVYRHLAFYRHFYMQGFEIKASDRGAYVELNSKKCLCECRSCGAHIEKRIYFTGECPYCHSSDLHAKVLSGESFYSVSNELGSAAGRPDFYRSRLLETRRTLYVLLLCVCMFFLIALTGYTLSEIAHYFDKEYQKKILLDPTNHLSSYDLIKGNIRDGIIYGGTVVMILFPLAVMRFKKIMAASSAIYWSTLFAQSQRPFIFMEQIPQLGSGKAKLNRMRRAIRNGYLKNCTLEVHDGVLMAALAKKTVKDRCLSCGAPLTGVTDENSRCTYCGNLIMGVIEKR